MTRHLQFSHSRFGRNIIPRPRQSLKLQPWVRGGPFNNKFVPGNPKQPLHSAENNWPRIAPNFQLGLVQIEEHPVLKIIRKESLMHRRLEETLPLQFSIRQSLSEWRTASLGLLQIPQVALEESCLRLSGIAANW